MYPQFRHQVLLIFLVSVSIAGIMNKPIDFQVYTAVYCELSMAITTRGKTPSSVSPLDP